MINRGSFSINEWCQRHHLCRATFYNLRDRGEGPDIMNVGNRVRISAEADARWIAEREDAAGNGRASQPAKRTRRVLIVTD